jgi:predicted HTH transcriptional regulator
MAEYSPFQKDFVQLDASDLTALRTVAEGWYVEYKREVPNASSIAKSVSAFANTYGGWLFYGIEEKSRDEPVAGAFPGIPPC